MTDREQALRDAIEAGISTLKKNFGEDYDRALVLQNVPLLLEVMWPFIEGYHARFTAHTFEEQFKRKFPDHELTECDGSVLDYIMNNVQIAVANEILQMLESWEQTMTDAQGLKKFKKEHLDRDWEVGRAHVKELISEVKQYRARGAKGSLPTYTGSIPTQESNDQH
jgi:hypothetical protein